MDNESPDPIPVSKTLDKRFNGVVVPMVTPATQDAYVDTDAIVRLIEYVVDAKADPFLFGTSGEASSISKEEKIRIASEVCPRFTTQSNVYMGISSNCLADAIDLAKAFADTGAQVAVANLPSYLSLSPKQMGNYFERLADAIPLPLIIYNIPITTHMSISLEIVETLSHHPNIEGLKDSERDLERLKSATAQFKDRDDFCHLTGWAAQSVNALQWGSDGLVPVTANLVPELYLDLYNATIQGDGDTANRLQNETNEISKIFQENRSLGDSLASIKALLNVSGICGTSMFPPLTAVTKEDEAQLTAKWTTFNKS